MKYLLDNIHSTHTYTKSNRRATAIICLFLSFIFILAILGLSVPTQIYVYSEHSIPFECVCFYLLLRFASRLFGYQFVRVSEKYALA